VPHQHITQPPCHCCDLEQSGKVSAGALTQALATATAELCMLRLVTNKTWPAHHVLLELGAKRAVHAV
jgi:hypothetical protein